MLCPKTGKFNSIIGMSQKRQYNLAISRDYARSTAPVMVRDVEGNILYWNRAAERNYGIRRSEAKGNVSHLLLRTVFPVPLAEINRELLRRGRWTGELIHTLQDGSTVKVNSIWELVPDGDAPQVVETNTNFISLHPRVAFLSKPRGLLEVLGRFLFEYRYWWLLPFLAVLIAAELLIEATPFGLLSPLFD